jgi:hypothetical protein
MTRAKSLPRDTQDWPSARPACTWAAGAGGRRARVQACAARQCRCGHIPRLWARMCPPWPSGGGWYRLCTSRVEGLASNSKIYLIGRRGILLYNIMRAANLCVDPDSRQARVIDILAQILYYATGWRLGLVRRFHGQTTGFFDLWAKPVIVGTRCPVHIEVC